MKTLLPLLAASLLGSAALLAQAQTPAATPARAAAPAAAAAAEAVPSAMQVRVWAATCMACHGTMGRAQPGMDSLAGKNRDEMIRKMQDFKTGRRPATIMHHHARGYTDVQIAAIASYFAALPR